MSEDCCTYDCTQGRNCPVRTNKLKPYPNHHPDPAPPHQDDEYPDKEPMTRIDLLAVIAMYSVSALSVVSVIAVAWNLIFNQG